MESHKEITRYFARLTDTNGVFKYIVRINESGCFVVDEENGWEHDEDYKEEAISNTFLYKELTIEEARKYLIQWDSEL